MACRRYYHCLEENLDISNLYKIAPEYLTRLSQDGDVILAKLFQHAPVIKDYVFLFIIPRQEILSLSLTHLISTEILNKTNTAPA